jgi:hypothetical protein
MIQENQNDSSCNGSKLCEMVNDVFLEHPRAAGEHYFQHLFYTVQIAGNLLLSALCAVTHGLFPKFFQTTTSDRVIALANDMLERRKHNKMLATPQPLSDE